MDYEEVSYDGTNIKEDSIPFIYYIEVIHLSTTFNTVKATLIMVKFNSLPVAVAAILTVYLLPCVGAATFDETCANFSTTIENVNITLHEVVSAGTNITWELASTCSDTFTVITEDICRLVMNVQTSNRSSLYQEVWLPRNWTGRFLNTGNPGVSGCNDFVSMNYGTGLGFASVSSDNGHSGQNGTLFLNNDDVVKDFVWRGLHASTEIGKNLTKEFYGEAHSKAYYSGCSGAGRQGMMMAQSFPEDFDGVLAGAPAFNFNNLTSWIERFQNIFADENFPPESTWDAIDVELLNQCDSIDGAADGIIEEPSLCNFKPEALICGTGATNTSACLTGGQAAVLREFFAPQGGIDGSVSFPGLQVAPGLIARIMTNYDFEPSTPFSFPNAWYRYAVFNDANHDTLVITPEETAFAWNLNLHNSNTWEGDLSAFNSRGGKLLHWHGQNDQQISSASSNLYYQHVQQTMGLDYAALDDFYRFFRVSGTIHCNIGNGASNIGYGLNTAASNTPQENIFLALVQWVEEGIAPDTVTGTAYIDQNATLGVDFKRAHCKYPTRNIYNGTGDVKDASSWNCII